MKYFNKINRHLIFDLLILFVFSLLPFWWLRGGYTILGHDAGLPVDPSAHFVDRLSTWTYRYAGGSDQSYALAGFFIHGLEFLLDQTNLSLSNQQAVQFSLYFFGFGISIYFLAKEIFPKQIYAPLIAGILYQFNHFILQAWFIAERTKFTTYIALPLILLYLNKVLNKKESVVRWGIITAITISILNGGGFLPLYGALLVVIPVFSLISIIVSKQKMEVFKKLLSFACVAIVSALLLNLYWILPYVKYVSTNFAQEVSTAGGLDGIIGWIGLISENTSYMNLFRLQGIQEWYVNPEHPYASFYSSSFYLVIFSFLMPLLIFLGVRIADRSNKSERQTFATLVLVLLFSIFFMAGSHNPFGGIYIWLIKTVPGFIAFRTPYYKFAPGFYLAFALIVGYIISKILQFFRPRLIHVSGLILFIAIILKYFFPFYEVDFFQYQHDRSTKVSIPSYVTDYNKFINAGDHGFQKTLLLPGSNPSLVVNYDWGYWSLASLHSLSDSHRYLSFNSGISSFNSTVEYLYQQIYTQDESWLKTVKFLKIDSILVEKDQVPFKYLDTKLDFDQVDNFVQKSDEVNLINSFGPWNVYKIEYQPQEKVASKLVQINARLVDISHIEFLDEKYGLDATLAILDKTSQVPSTMKVDHLWVAECADCFLDNTFNISTRNLPIPGSIPYKLKTIFGQRIVYDLNPMLNSYLAAKAIRKSVLVNSKPSDRLTAWDNYIYSLKNSTDYIRQISENKVLNVADNDLRREYYSNLKNQEEDLNFASFFIDQSIEGKRYLEAKSILQEAQKIITFDTFTTTSTNEKLVVFDVDTTNNYSIFIDQMSINDLLGELGFVEIDGVKTYINPVKLENNWWQLGSFVLEKGIHTLKILDVSKSLDILELQPKLRNVSLNSNQSCSTSTIGVLPKGRYKSTFKLLPVEVSNLTLHIYPKSDPVPLLPNWSIISKTDNLLFHEFDLDVKRKDEYLVSICDHTLNKEVQIEINKFVLEFISDPMVLYKISDSEEIQFRNVSVNLEKKSDIEYSIESDGAGLINTDIPFSSGWQTTAGEIVSINDGVVGVWLEQPEKFEITYSPEELYNLGKMISVAAGAFLLGILIFI